MSLSSENLLKRLNQLAVLDDYSVDWVSPEWEPIIGVPEEDRRVFMFILNRCLGAIAMKMTKTHGITKVSWSKLPPEREFLIGEDEDIKEYMRIAPDE